MGSGPGPRHGGCRGILGLHQTRNPRDACREGSSLLAQHELEGRLCFASRRSRRLRAEADSMEPDCLQLVGGSVVGGV